MKGKKYLTELLSNKIIIEEYKNEITKYVDNLEQEKEQLKEDISKLQKELNEENLQCSKYAIEINNLKENNKQLKDNWDELKEYIRTEYKRLHGILETPSEFEMMALLEVFDKIQELEQGSENGG